MAILWICPDCRHQNSLSKRECRCGRKGNSGRKYVVVVSYKRKRKTATAPNLSIAREIEASLKSELIRSHHLGEEIVTRAPLLADFYREHYLPFLRSQNRSAKKADSLFRHWILPRFGGKRLDEISPHDVERLKMEILRAGRAPRTAQHVLALLRALFNRASSWGFFFGRNPVKGIRVPYFDNRRVRFLTREEAGRLLEECRRRTTPRNLLHPMVLLALSTGMRAGEIFNLRVQDVDLRNSLAHVRDPKSGVNRTVFLSEEIKAILADLCKGKEPHRHVFEKPGGRKFDEIPRTFVRVVKKLGFNEGVTDPREKVVFHTLRHTFCSWLAQEGVPLHVIKELAGHRTIEMTERYSHLMPDIRREAVRRVIWSKLFGEGK